MNTHRNQKVKIVKKGLKLILENTFFEFNGSYYSEKLVTAMDTRMDLSFANLVTGFLENIFYHNVQENFGKLFFPYIEINRRSI